MRMHRTWASALSLGVAFALTACTDPAEIGEMKAKIEEMQAAQKDIVTKLDGLSKGQKQILAKAPAAPAKRPTEDPNKVYKIPVGDSYFKGPEDAAVTIIEFSDFQ